MQKVLSSLFLQFVLIFFSSFVKFSFLFFSMLQISRMLKYVITPIILQRKIERCKTVRVKSQSLVLFRKSR